MAGLRAEVTARRDAGGGRDRVSHYSRHNLHGENSRKCRVFSRSDEAQSPSITRRLEPPNRRRAASARGFLV